ncbi:MAG: YtxH domain-containing protein [Thermoflexales bacterium]
MGRITRFLEGFLLGAVSGAAAALLLAPSSGWRTRHTLRREFEEVVLAGRQAAAQRRRELKAYLQALRGDNEAYA